MFLVEQTKVPTEVLPVGRLRDQLRLGTGFDDDAVQDGLLEGCLRGAIAAVEAHCDKAVLERPFAWSVAAWRDLGRQVLPVAPVSEITQLAIVDRFEEVEEVAPARYVLVRDANRPALTATGFMLPQIPVGGRAVIEFVAGYGAAWDDVPADLARAVLMLAAAYYEDRGGSAGMPEGVATLLAPRRNLRLFGLVRS